MDSIKPILYSMEACSLGIPHHPQSTLCWWQPHPLVKGMNGWQIQVERKGTTGPRYGEQRNWQPSLPETFSLIEFSPHCYSLGSSFGALFHPNPHTRAMPFFPPVIPLHVTVCHSVCTVLYCTLIWHICAQPNLLRETHSKASPAMAHTEPRRLRSSSETLGSSRRHWVILARAWNSGSCFERVARQSSDSPKTWSPKKHSGGSTSSHIIWPFGNLSLNQHELIVNHC